MLRQTSFWLGILTTLAVLAVAGVIATNWPRATIESVAVAPTATAVAEVVIPTMIPSPVDPPQPTPSAADCRTQTVAWVSSMNDVLVMMINTNDAQPVATGRAFRTAQTMLTEFALPACADDQLRAIDTSLRASVPLYISWTDALIAGDTAQAQSYEDQGDGLFVIDAYFTYLENNDYADLVTQFNTKLQRAASGQPVDADTGTDALSAYDACVAEVFAFRIEADGLYEVSQYHIKTLESYVQQQPVTNLDPDLIDRAYQSTDKITAPTCIDEPTEILYNLRLMFNTLKPAFVEAKVELAAGNPDAASYALVQGWIDELKGFDRDLAALYESMPQSLAALADEPLVDQSLVDESLDDRPLQEYALQLSDFPQGMIAESSSMRTPEEAAQGWEDATTALANFNRFGRKNTYVASFTRPADVPVARVGADMFNVGVTHTTSAANTIGLVRFIVASNSDYDRIEVPLDDVDETVAIRKQEECRDETTAYTCTFVRIYVAKGNVMTQLAVASYVSDDVDLDLVAKYAQIMADRIDR